MTVETLALLVAIAVPIAGLITLVGLIASVREMERSRDELIELRVSGT